MAAMPAQLEPFVLPMLWLLAGIVIVWALTPLLLHVLGLSRYVQTIETRPADLAVSEDESDYDDVFQQLRALGFEPLGAYRESHWFFFFHWVKSFRTRVLVCHAHRCFACVYRLARGEQVRVAFVTCLGDSGLVWSSNSLETHHAEEEDFVRWGYVTDDLAQLFPLHQQLVEKLRSPTREPEIGAGLSLLLGAVARINQRHPRQDRRLALHFLKVCLFALGTCPLVAVLVLGHDHWTVPFGVLFGAIGWVAFLVVWPRVLRRKRAREVRVGGQVVGSRR
jgi:hypothetical protein